MSKASRARKGAKHNGQEAQESPPDPAEDTPEIEGVTYNEDGSVAETPEVATEEVADGTGPSE